MKSIRNPHSAFPNRIIYPVILAVPDAVKKLKPKERVKFLRGHARRAVEISAEKSRIPLGELAQDEHNAPLPFNGNFWSITHKPQYVGAVVAPSPIGIDIERIDERPESLFRVGVGRQDGYHVFSLLDGKRSGAEGRRHRTQRPRQMPHYPDIERPSS